MVCKYSFLDDNTYRCSRIGGDCRLAPPNASACEIAQIPTGEDALHAAQTIKRFCIRRVAGNDCGKSCVLYSFCSDLPLVWEGPSKSEGNRS